MYVNNISRKLYGRGLINAELIGNSTNRMYELEGGAILRVSDYSAEKLAHVQFELRWLHYLADGMSEVARVIPSLCGNVCECAELDGGRVIVAAFEKARGGLANQQDNSQWNDDLFANVGAAMGKMHALSSHYTLTMQEEAAFQWDSDIFFSPEYSIAHDAEVFAQRQSLLQQLAALPKSSSTYGVIHADIHHRNFFADGTNITIFDFDDCICGWYAYDIAVTLHSFISTIPYGDQHARDIFARQFFAEFVRGYTQHFSLDPRWSEISQFMLKYRRVCVYAFIDKLYPQKENNPYGEYKSWLRQMIVADKPVLSQGFAIA